MPCLASHVETRGVTWREPPVTAGKRVPACQEYDDPADVALRWRPRSAQWPVLLLCGMDPLGLLPYALAAGGGRVDSHEASALVAAGFTLLQRSLPLVRALGTAPVAVRPARWAEVLVALAASDGRGLRVLPPQQDSAGFLHPERGPAELSVDLRATPLQATVCTSHHTQVVDLGSHFGLDLIGDTETAGREEPCLALADQAAWISHRQLLHDARTAMATHAFAPVHRTLVCTPFTSYDGLVHGVLAPLLAGGAVLTGASLGVPEVHAMLADGEANVVVCAPDMELPPETTARVIRVPLSL